MDSCDEKLTLENVDEQVEQCLAHSQGLQSSAATSLTRTVYNLQSVYEEERRLSDVWTRINSRVSALNSEHADGLSGQGQAPVFSTIQGGKKAPQDAREGSLDAVSRRSGKQSRLLSRRSWYAIGIGLVAAMILITFVAWPIVSYALHGSWITGPHPPTNHGTPQTQPTVDVSKQTVSNTTPTAKPATKLTPIATASASAVSSPTTNLPGIKVYGGQYFTIQYPADWVITNVTTGNGYVQTVQFRPSATSSVFANVNVMSHSDLTSDLLLLLDTDVKQGTLQSTSSVTYHAITWTVGMVDNSSSTPPSKLEVAYSNQGTPYRIEFGAPSDTFSTYTPAFNAMFASFYPAS